MRIREKDEYNKIKATCDSRLSYLYPVHVPENILRRYKYEMEYLRISEYVCDFYIFSLLSRESAKHSIPFGMKGTVTGSLIYYLLSDNSFNPLQAHYYCAKCGYYEELITGVFGIDISDKICPCCGKHIYGDGYNIPIESVWGNNGKKIISFEYEVSRKFLSIATEMLLEVHPEYPVYMSISSDIELLTNLFSTSGYCVNDNTYYNLKRVSWDKIIDVLERLGVLEVEIFKLFSPKSYYEMVAVEAIAHNMYTWQYSDNNLNRYKEMLEDESFKECQCYTRDDFFEILVKNGVVRPRAFNVSEQIRKGYAGISARKEGFENLDIPEKIKAVARKCLYISSRAQCIEKILRYARISYALEGNVNK